jgi:hypothetical protein
MAWTTPRTWVVGEVLTAANMNTHLRDNVSWLGNPPTCRVYNSAALATTSGTPLPLTYNSERWDTESMHSTVTNTERLLAPVAGKYRVGAAVRYASNATNQRELYIERFNSSNVSQGVYIHKIVPAINGNITDVDVNTEIEMNLNDYVKIVALQNSGGGINITVSGKFTPEAWMTWFSI